MGIENIMLSWAELRKSFITLGPGLEGGECHYSQKRSDTRTFSKLKKYISTKGLCKMKGNRTLLMYMRINSILLILIFMTRP